MLNNYSLPQFHRLQPAIVVASRLHLPPLFTIALLVSVALLWLYTPIGAQPGANCSASFFVDQTLQNGARWQLCWEHRNLDGIVLRDITYTPPGGVSQRVLAQGSISQVHVPYDDNSARFHDITDDGFGDNNLNDLTPEECPAGVLLKFGAKDAICQQIQARGYAFKGVGVQEQGELLSLFSVSTSGEYNYIPVWRFLDDGAIELEMGAAGKLQRFTADSRYGWPVRADGTRGTSHLHNYYWRLDFDLGAGGDNDLVEEFNYAPSADGTQRTLGVSRLTNEAGRSIHPTGLRSWRIRDGLTTNANGAPISYQLEPNEVGHRDVGPSFEPWTANDFYVTKFRDCERYVSHNPQLGGCADNLAGFVNGESLEGADVVLWYGVTFHHIPRDEDEPLMHAHWSSFRLTPRDWMAANPAAADVITCAVGDVTCDTQTNAADALFMLQHDVRLRTISNQLPLPGGTLYGYSCDVSGEGACNAVDALLTLQCSVGLANKFCPPMQGMQEIQTAQLSVSSALLTIITVEENPDDADGAIHKQIHATASAEVGALSLALTYDPAWSGIVTCSADPMGAFDLDACNVDPGAGVVRFSLIAAAGGAGKMSLGEVHFTPSTNIKIAVPMLGMETVVVADPAGNSLPVKVSRIDLANPIYLPMIIR